MALYKNKSSQKLAVFAYDSSDGTAKTGDAANITAQISLNGGATAATNDANPTELDATDAPGIYLFDLTQAETNADLIVVAPVSATANILLEPAIIYTEPEQRSADVTALSGDTTAADNLEAALDGTGGVTITAALTGNVTGNLSGNVTGSVGSVLGGINTGAGTITTLDALDTAQDAQHSTTQSALSTAAANVATLLGKFTGITLLAQWLGLIAGKQTGDSTARTEVRATGAGSGTFDETTDSLEALRDNTGTAGAGLTEAGGDGDHLTEAGGTGDHLTDVPWNPDWDTEVQSEVQDAIEANHLDHLLAVDYDPASKPGISTALLNELVENDGGVSRFTENALEQAASAAVDEAAIAAAVVSAIGSGRPITIASPVAENGDITIYRGDDYTGSEIPIPLPTSPDLTGATAVTWKTRSTSKTLTVTGAGTSNQRGLLALTAAETAAYAARSIPYEVDADLASGAHKTLRTGSLIVRQNLAGA